MPIEITALLSTEYKSYLKTCKLTNFNKSLVNNVKVAIMSSVTYHLWRFRDKMRMPELQKRLEYLLVVAEITSLETLRLITLVLSPCTQSISDAFQ